MRINPEVIWIKPKSPEENGLGSEVLFVQRKRNLGVHHPVIKLEASLARNREVTFTEIHYELIDRILPNLTNLYEINQKANITQKHTLIRGAKII